MNSKKLAYILRHDPGSVGVTLDGEGWCDVASLLKALRISRRELDDTVYSNTRFVYSPDGTKIRAAHGHSVKVTYGGDFEPDGILYHGTSLKVLPSIMRDGIKPMARAAVHLSLYGEDAGRIGLRHTGGNRSDVVILAIDAKAMHADGFRFHKSEDGVILVDEVPAKYIGVSRRGI